MSITTTRPDFRALYADQANDVGVILVAAMDEAQNGLKGELRDQVRASGLGERLAKAWQGNTYPKAGASFDPAGYVWTKAPKVIDAFDRGASIYPLGGRRYLAVPTKNVPQNPGAGRGRSGLMTPADVEALFAQSLIIRKGQGGKLLAFINAVPSLSARAIRPPTQRRLARGRKPQLVLMFVFVPSVKLPKKLDIDGAADRWADAVPGLIDKHWS